jgi:general secretion pathway protein C
MTPREIRFGIDGLSGIVIASVAAALALLTWRLAGEAAGSSAVAAAASAYVAPTPPPDVSALINLPPFGKVSAASATIPAGSGLVLHGVLLTVPAPASAALIAPAGKESVAYRTGETLPNGAVLEGIGEDHVLLRIGGQSLSLYFTDDPRGAAQAAGAAGAAVPQAAGAAQNPVVGAASAPAAPPVRRPEPGPPTTPPQSGPNR